MTGKLLVISAIDTVLCFTSAPSFTETADQHTANEISQLTKLMAKMDRFRAVLDQPNVDLGRLIDAFSYCRSLTMRVDLEKLRKLSWNGIPTELRPTAWKLLMVFLAFFNIISE